MKENEASHSAAIIAAHRAFDSARPSAERICYDPYAEQLIGRGFTVVGKFDLPGETALELFNAVVPGFHEFFLARTRYIDDHLETGIKNGLEQLVILGDGLRHRYSLSRMRPFRPDRFKEVKTGDRDSTRMPVGPYRHCSAKGKSPRLEFQRMFNLRLNESPLAFLHSLY